METLNTVVELLQKVLAFGGALGIAFSLVMLGTSLKDHQGPGITSALWMLAGSALICAAGVVVGNLIWS